MKGLFFSVDLEFLFRDNRSSTREGIGYYTRQSLRGALLLAALLNGVS